MFCVNLFYFALLGATLIEYHILLYSVKCFLTFLFSSFISMCEIKIVFCRFIGLSQRRNLSYHSVLHMSTGNCIIFHLFFYHTKTPIFRALFAMQLSFFILIVEIVFILFLYCTHFSNHLLIAAQHFTLLPKESIQTKSKILSVNKLYILNKKDCKVFINYSTIFPYFILHFHYYKFEIKSPLFPIII